MPKPPDSNYEWAHIENFTPGIISQANFAYAGSDNSAPTPAMLGAAQADGTYGCIALPNGGLGPMPGPTGTIIAGPSAATQPSGTNYITGFTVYGPVAGNTGGSPGDELVYCVDVVDGTTRTTSICATQVGGLWNRVIHSQTGTSTPGETYGFSAGLTVVTLGLGTNQNVQATLAIHTACLNTSSALGATAFLGLYPDPTSLTTIQTATPLDCTAALPPKSGSGDTGSSTTAFSGWIFCHAGRICFAEQSEYYWTANNVVLVDDFDQFYWTDPPNSTPNYTGGTNSLNQQIVYVPEHPVGMGAFGSVSAGELFAVKSTGGACIISGDPTDPTVTFLGGVQSTGGTTSMTANTPMGLIYLSNNNGAWLWNGGSQAQKVSLNINDDFYSCPMPPNIGAPAFSMGVWGNLVLFPNNYVLDTATGGFWKLDNQAVQYCYYGLGYDSNTMYCVPSTTNNSTRPIAYVYKRTTPATTYQWQSYPLPPTEDVEYSVTIREVVIRSQGVGIITVTLNGTGGSTIGTVPATQTINSVTQPVRYIFDTGMIGAQDVCITVLSQGSGGGPAPIIYSIDIGYERETRLNAT